MIKHEDLERILGEHFGHEGDRLIDLGIGYRAYNADSDTYWAFSLVDGMVIATMTDGTWTKFLHGRTADDVDDLGNFLEFMLS